MPSVLRSSEGGQHVPTLNTSRRGVPHDRQTKSRLTVKSNLPNTSRRRRRSVSRLLRSVGLVLPARRPLAPLKLNPQSPRRIESHVRLTRPPPRLVCPLSKFSVVNVMPLVRLTPPSERPTPRLCKRTGQLSRPPSKLVPNHPTNCMPKPSRPRDLPSEPASRRGRKSRRLLPQSKIILVPT